LREWKRKVKQTKKWKRERERKRKKERKRESRRKEKQIRFVAKEKKERKLEIKQKGSSNADRVESSQSRSNKERKRNKKRIRENWLLAYKLKRLASSRAEPSRVEATSDDSRHFKQSQSKYTTNWKKEKERERKGEKGRGRVKNKKKVSANNLPLFFHDRCLWLFFLLLLSVINKRWYDTINMNCFDWEVINRVIIRIHKRKLKKTNIRFSFSNHIKFGFCVVLRLRKRKL
jgi:hypothetical protein